MMAKLLVWSHFSKKWMESHKQNLKNDQSQLLFFQIYIFSSISQYKYTVME